MSSAGTNPVADDAVASDAPEVNDEAIVDTNDTEAADEGEESESVEDDTDEIDLEGKKYRIPKAVKPAIMMHGDYTKKTQELAEQRKQFEASRTAAQAVDDEHIQAKAKVVALDDRLKEYDDALGKWAVVDWDTLTATNPELAQKEWIRFSQLKNSRADLAQARDNATKTVDETAQKRTLEQQNIRSKLIEEATAQLPKLIPGWAPGNEVDLKIAKYGTAEGYSPKELVEATIQNPRYVATLNKARQWDEYQASQKVAKRAAVQEEARPVAEVGSKSPAAKNPDRMTTEEWMKYETARMAKKRAGR